MQILDPTNEQLPIRRALTPRPVTLSGTVALLDISKPRGDVLVDRRMNNKSLEVSSHDSRTSNC